MSRRDQLQTITVGALRHLLDDSGADDDMLVAFTCEYGDYCRTLQVLPIGAAETGYELEGSGYSSSGWAIKDDLTQDEQDDLTEDEKTENEAAAREQPPYLILSSSGINSNRGHR